MSSKKIYTDLTASLTSNTVIFPGDPQFTTKHVECLQDGSAYGLSEMHLSNHTGTHIDFPAHVIKGGKTSSDYSVNELIGNGVIIEVPSNVRSISQSFVLSQSIIENDIVFFKTHNSTFSKQEKFREDYVYIESGAAHVLLDKGVRIVGIDYVSVDNYSEEQLPVHGILLSNNILIVENLELQAAAPGRCEIFIMPLNIPDMDGLPARVVMLKVD